MRSGAAEVIATLVSRVGAMFRRRSAERELRAELDFHIALETQKYIAEGLSPAEARRHALVTFGSVDAHAEAVRDRRTFRWIDDALADVRYALRWLRSAPTFTAVAVLTFGVGIGATTAIFTVVNAVLLRPLPYPDADELALIFAQHRERDVRRVNISYPDYLTYRRELRSFERIGVFNWNNHTISGDGVPAERVPGAEVDAELFPVLGVEPLLGRGVVVEEEVEGRNRVVILGYGLWQRRYGGDRTILGRSIAVNGQPHVVIGVMPPGFQFPYAGEVWRPIAPDADYLSRSSRFLAGAVGRLRDGITRAQAEAELARVSQTLQRAYPDSNTGWEGEYVPLREDLFGLLSPAMLIVLAAAALVLLIVCSNVASLLLARSASRAREIAMRAALGARRSRLLRQLLTESAVLTITGGTVGMLVAYGGAGVLRNMLTDRIPAFIHIAPDLRVYGFAVMTTAFVALLTGILPALRGTRVDPHGVLKQGTRSTSGPHAARLRGALVVAEVALAVVLLVGAALLIRSMNALTSIDTGFQAQNILTARYNLPPSKYDSPERRALYQSALLERLRAQPGVIEVGAAQGTPFSGWNVGTRYEVEGEPPAPLGSAPIVHFQSVTPEFFDVLGVPLLRGRMIASSDGPTSDRVALVNEAFAARHFAGRDPVGRRFRLCCTTEAPWRTIVGVVADYRHYRLIEPMTPAAFLPYAQEVRQQMTVVLRTAGAPDHLIPVLRRVMAELDPDVPAFSVETLEEVLARETWVQRIARDIVAAFAATAALLAMIGLYGVISYSVACQRHELGIRLALGAAPHRLLRLVVRQGIALSLIGITLGWLAARITSTLFQRLLFRVHAADATTFVAVPLIVASLAILAALLPARRAAATDPMIALRTE